MSSFSDITIGDSELDDEATVRSVGLLRKVCILGNAFHVIIVSLNVQILAHYSLCHLKIIGCTETHKSKCKCL